MIRGFVDMVKMGEIPLNQARNEDNLGVRGNSTHANNRKENKEVNEGKYASLKVELL